MSAFNAQQRGESAGDGDGSVVRYLPCSFCGMSTQTATLSQYGARCFEAYCRERPAECSLSDRPPGDARTGPELLVANLEAVQRVRGLTRFQTEVLADVRRKLGRSESAA